MLEREVKLHFASLDLARQRLLSAPLAATLLRGRRLQEDALLDTSDGRLRQQRSALRVRRENGATLLTFKGPVLPGTMKMREEHETAVVDGAALLTILERSGWQTWFRYEKFREEFSTGDAVIAIDETPIGVFVEVEGGEDAIHRVAAALGKGPADYVTSSYRALYVEDCNHRGVVPTHMLF